MLCLATLSARGFYVRGEVAISERRSRDRGAGYTKKKTPQPSRIVSGLPPQKQSSVTLGSRLLELWKS